MAQRWIALLLSAGLVLLLAGAALAAAQGYALDWWTVDGGGGQSVGGEYALRGGLFGVYRDEMERHFRQMTFQNPSCRTRP